LRGQVYELTGVEPEYYFDMGFLDFVQFIDALGGVTVNVPVDMSLKDVMTGDWIELSAGEQTLDGAQALVFSRVRKIFAAAQDACRQMDDRSVVASVLNYIANNPDAIEQGVSALYDNAETNWDRAEFTALVEDFAKNADKFTILSGTGPYDGDIDGDTGQWMAYRDEGTWHQIIETVDAGGDPTEIVGLPYQAV
ncbi:MAG: LCP family protein, partial [Eggerthellaceae bacterium]|nr:LCP family protein [Eggerthellaceae bacterium]